MPHHFVRDETTETTETTETIASPAQHMARVAEKERVSAPELAAALAAIETRRTADAHFEAGTITVGEAIVQLNLDIAASEVLTEVLAQREQKADDLALRRIKRRRAVFASVFPVTLAALCIGVGASVLQNGREAQSAPADVPRQTIPAPMFRPENLRVSDTNTRTGKVTIRTLAEVPDNHPVRVLSGDLLRHVSLSTPPDFVLSSSSPPQMAQWTLVKHDGRAYLRGYVGAPMSDAALQAGEVMIYNHTEVPRRLGLIGPNPSPITFRIEQLRGRTDGWLAADDSQQDVMPARTDDDWQRIVLPGLVGDKYLWEK